MASRAPNSHPRRWEAVDGEGGHEAALCRLGPYLYSLVCMCGRWQATGTRQQVLDGHERHKDA